MNAVEIEEAISRLVQQPFEREEFPYAFLEAFGNKTTTINRLRKRDSNKTDIEGAVLQHNNIHMAVSPAGEVLKTLERLKNSPATARQKAKYILATDGEDFQAEDITSGETIACEYKDFPNHFGFFLPLAGITTVKQIRESSFDIRATSRLNRLYVELLKDNPEWSSATRRHDMNHFMARLIFCFFAEDTDIFNGDNLFTATIDQMSAKDSSNTHEVISELFRAMNTKINDRAAAKLPRWADVFPYVNGGLFSGSTDVPRFSKIARSYLLHVGHLDWQKINPDIFGSMIQAVAEDSERGALGMHYTSVPNILKVLNPLFLDDLRSQLEAAENSPQKLLNLRKRMAKIRVFDPACGSGNFLVIAYKQMREIEAEINQRRGEQGKRTEIPITNFRGIELKDFPAEIARLALIIAEYQCDILYRGQKEALAEFLPLDAQNWITCGNALRLDWLSICPPTGTGVKLYADDLFHTPLDQAQIDFENEGGETYVCGNPPYKGSQDQSAEEKADLVAAFNGAIKSTKSADYVSGWFIKAREYIAQCGGLFAFVTTNSVCQGRQVDLFWPAFLKEDLEIRFAIPFCRKFLGSHDSIQGEMRYCLWIQDDKVDDAASIPPIKERIDSVRAHRLKSDRAETNALAATPHAFGERRHQNNHAMLIPRHSSESRPYLPALVIGYDTVIGDSAIAMYDFTLPDFAIYSSRLHVTWIATVCGKIKTDYRYSNTLGWNTFPVPPLTEKTKADLTRCAEDILLAREAHFPATIADLYDPENMPENLRHAHERNDEVLERIYIGRRFKNDTERLEKLFDLYTKMTAKPTVASLRKAKG